MKKLSILLAVVVLLAAVGIGVLVNQKNQVNTQLNEAKAKTEDTQKLLDEAVAKTAETETTLQQAQQELEAAKADADAAAAELGSQLEAAKAEFAAKEQDYVTANAELAKQAKDAKATVLGLRLMLDNAKLGQSTATLKSEELLALVDTATSEKAQINATLDLAIAEKAQLESDLNQVKEQVTTLEAAIATLEQEKDDALGQVSTLQAQLADFETVKAEAQAEMDKLNAQTGTLSTDMEAALKANAELEAAKALAEGKVTELETAKAEADAKVTELDAAKVELEAKVSELNEAKVLAEAKVSELEEAAAKVKADYDALASQAELLTSEKAGLEERLMLLETPETPEEPVAVEAPQGFKHGLGMVTSIGSVADATAEKAGAAQVNTTVCALVLDLEGKIVSVTWDVQQTKIQFSAEGKPVDLPETLLTKLEKGADYGMKARSEIGKEWNEQIEAFAQYALGKTVEEVMSIATFDRGDGSHNAVPDVEELKASVTITVGDYLASLQKAADSAK